MDEVSGQRILEKIRENYRRGYKSSDKYYVVTTFNGMERREIERHRNRAGNAIKAIELLTEFGDIELLGYRAGDAFEMSMQAAKLVAKVCGTGRTHIGIVCPPAKHAFCVVDYQPHGNSAKTVNDIVKDNFCKGAWVIDPYMNISCPYKDYPARAAAKHAVWSKQGKRIFGNVEFDLEIHDPINPTFTDRFFKSGPLRFEPVYEVDLSTSING